jgi:cell shape-determining protein MreC
LDEQLKEMETLKQKLESLRTENAQFKELQRVLDDVKARFQKTPQLTVDN